MKEAQNLLLQEQWRVIDQTMVGLHGHALQSFGMDDTLCASVGSKQSPATARAWVHPRTIVLGIQDSKLPFLKEGLTYLEEQNYQYIVRNSGGLAVVLDEGVLNLSLIFPEVEKGIDINRGYDAMWLLVQEMFADFPQKIVAKEIVGSYCPGSYDLSINDKKFAGISQRRLRNGVAVQIYLCVNGSGSERAELIQNFYNISKGNSETKFEYPTINPSVMQSLSELLEVGLTVQDVMLRFLNVLKNKSNFLFSGTLTDEELPLFESYYQRVIERNEKMLNELK
ncbi:biotin/lipoate A/B protein ligase family protein [Bacillus sp. 31A1R]|uniref:Octanoyl-[GcvH]:protein N-octanoyltransferase n=1 Tax=Robertmurraya mangrovi TaxID=3098077 RepID=A0ABU5IX73_9BACI|nr:biotin/lipoate A/B protein ligase family protein [Bacillus sp. 31A1R]MDZ5471758.1 biotin/lipoate A/B protein ligase family protein [Bacillus sp. 31A1R]